MAVVPVKIEKDGKWVVSKIDIQKEGMTIAEPFSKNVPFKSVVDLEQKKNVLFITLKGEPPVVLKVASVEKVLHALKKFIIMSCSAYRLMAYFMSPAVRGGVMATNATWEKGAIAVLKTSIWFVSQNKQVSVTLSEVTGIELTKREVTNKQADVVKIEHLEDGEVVVSYVLCPISTLQILMNFLADATKDMEMTGDELDPVSAQVGMLIYSGMDSHAIENMLSISHKELDRVYDNLLKLGLIEVVLIRKEVTLTPKGVRFITDSVKPPSQ